MGLFDYLKKVVSTENIKGAVTDVFDTLGGAFTKPGTFITNPIQAKTDFGKMDQKEQITRTVINTGAAAAGLVAAPSIGAALVPTTTKGLILTGITGTAATASFINNPSGTAKTIGNAPGNLANFILNIEKTATSRSLTEAEANLKETFAENPLLATGTTVAGLIAGVKTATSIANIVTTERNTAALENRAAGIGDTVTSTEKAAAKAIETNANTPILPETTTVTTNEGRNIKGKSRKRKAKKVQPNINIKIDNRDFIDDRDVYNTKRYIKRGA